MQLKMNDSALTGRHRIEPERHPRFPDALCRNPRRKFQLLETQGAVISAVEANMIVKSRFQMQPAMSEVLKGEEKFGLTLKEEIAVGPIEGDEYFNRIGFSGFRRPSDNSILQIELRLTNG